LYLLKDKFGEVTKISGDIKDMPIFKGLEAPLKPYSSAIQGYGNATYLKDADNIYRRQIMVARLSEQLEAIKLSELTVNYSINTDNFERLAWIDKNRNIVNIDYPLTDSSISKLKSDIEKNGILIEKDDDKYYEVYKYRDHFIPSITLSLALAYYNLTPFDVEVKMGEYIRLIEPKIMTSEPEYELIKDDNGQTVKNDAGLPVSNLIKEPEYSTIDDIYIPIDEKGAMLINYVGPRSEVGESSQTFNIREFNGYVSDPGPNPENWKTTYLLTNKIIMVGVFATGLAEDEKPTPYGLMYGVEINANALNTILMNRFLFYAPPWVSALILFGIIMIVSFMSSRLSTIWSLIISLLLSAVFFIIVVFVFDFYNYILTFSAPFFASILTFLSIVAYRVMTEERAKKRIKNMFGKYVNPTVVEEMMSSPPELGGVDKDLTVFFSDIRGFTTLSESMSPQALVNHLNNYLTVMTDIIMEYKGTLDKYVGDEIMCFWGAPIPQENHAILACKCAIKQMNALRELNEGWPAEKRINIGIGLNSGIMTVGNMGSQGRMNYTLMGDNVNLGARLEGTNKQYKTNIIISEYTYGTVKDKIVARELDNIRVKGKNKPVLIYELLDVIEGLEP
jgi:adenylate cyclase